MSLVELTKGYNQAFRSTGSKRDSTDLIQAIQKLPNFKVLGIGQSVLIRVGWWQVESYLGASPSVLLN